MVIPNYKEWLVWKSYQEVENDEAMNNVKNTSESEEHWEIEDILDHKETKNGLKLLVKWHNWDNVYNALIRIADLKASKLLQQYLKSKSLEIVDVINVKERFC